MSSVEERNPSKAKSKPRKRAKTNREAAKKLTEGQLKEIADAVRLYTNIWDLGHPEHKKADSVAASWEIVAELVNLPGMLLLS